MGVSRDIPGPLAIQIIPPILPASRKPVHQETTQSIVDPQIFPRASEGNTENAHMESTTSKEDETGAINPNRVNIVFAAREKKVYFFIDRASLGSP